MLTIIAESHTGPLQIYASSGECGIKCPQDLRASFLDEELRTDFDEGCRDVYKPAPVLSFITAAKQRLINIYAGWFDTLDVDILANLAAKQGPETHG